MRSYKPFPSPWHSEQTPPLKQPTKGNHALAHTASTPNYHERLLHRKCVYPTDTRARVHTASNPNDPSALRTNM